ncbi:hypothetical protein LTR66_003379 [Elasticomyces elasticus]|nr:hypothetical protein LTR50_002620 [Elasticomyces elasticus]KAK4997155.1 hypothetical protein LTR66_003379 [Elasticomyces elasticus]
MAAPTAAAIAAATAAVTAAVTTAPTWAATTAPTAAATPGSKVRFSADMVVALRRLPEPPLSTVRTKCATIVASGPATSVHTSVHSGQHARHSSWSLQYYDHEHPSWKSQNM